MSEEPIEQEHLEPVVPRFIGSPGNIDQFRRLIAAQYDVDDLNSIDFEGQEVEVSMSNGEKTRFAVRWSDDRSSIELHPVE